MDTQPQPIAQPTIIERAKSWLGTRQSLARGVVAVGVLAIGCGCCGFGYVVGSTGSPSKPAAAAQSTVTPTAPGTATPALPTGTAKPKAWVTVQHFSGNQNQQTASLHIPAGSRIVWSVKPSSEFGGNFIVEADYADGSGMAALIANAITPPAQSGTYNT